jgi:hypothetical protein
VVVWVRFSKHYKTFTAWKRAMPRTSQYAQRVIRLHKLNPTANLNQIRRGKNLITTLGQTPFEFLNPRQKVEYKHSLDILRVMRRKNLSLTQAAQQVKLSPRKALKYIGKALKKIRGRYHAKQYDTIYRKMHIFEQGKRTTITVTNSKDATRIGQYHSAVGRLVYNQDTNALDEFKDDALIDIDGNKRTFETDPDTVLLILSRIEQYEFFHIYADE